MRVMNVSGQSVKCVACVRRATTSDDSTLHVLVLQSCVIKPTSFYNKIRKHTKICQQYYRTVLLPGSVYIYCLIVPHRNCRKKCRLDHFSLQKWRKIGDFKVDFFEKFFGGIASRPPYWGGATAPLPRPHPLGAPALRASLRTFGPSIVRERTRTGLNFF